VPNCSPGTQSEYRRLAGEHGVERCTQSVNVGAGVGAGWTILLRRGVAWRVSARAGRCHATIVAALFGNAKIHQDSDSFGRDFDVSRLDVAVDYVILVQIIKCAKHILNLPQHVGLGKCAQTP